MEGTTEKLPRLLTATELSTQIGLSRFRLYELVRETDFPAIRLGRSIRFDKKTVAEYLRNGGTPPTGRDG